MQFAWKSHLWFFFRFRI